MQPVVETLSGLERRVELVLSANEIAKSIRSELQRVARRVKVPGFRPGKAPLSIIERSHGAGVQHETINAELLKAFRKVVAQAGLNVAGMPFISPTGSSADSLNGNLDKGQDTQQDKSLTFSATFEVYPEITLPDLGSLHIKRATMEVADADIQRTLDILRKQRAVFEPREGRAAQNEDRVTLDFAGKIDGEAFEGGSAEKFPFILGQGRMLPEFETAVTGMQAGESKTFPLTFPADYAGKAVAGKTAEFSITVTEVAEAVLPEVNSDFAKALGQAEGDVDKLLADIRANVEREVRARLRTRTKNNVMQALLAAATFDVPKALVDSEAQERVAAARAELKARGMKDADKLPIPPETFTEEAQRRVRLGLLVSELIKSAALKVEAGQLRARLEEVAQSYEQPDQVITYYLSDADRRAEVEALVLEDNVVDHVLANARVADETVSFEELMGTAREPQS